MSWLKQMVRFRGFLGIALADGGPHSHFYFDTGQPRGKPALASQMGDRNNLPMPRNEVFEYHFMTTVDCIFLKNKL